MLFLPARSEVPHKGTVASMGMAKSSLVSPPCGLCGPFKGKMFLITVDAFSKLIEVQQVPSATSQNTIQKLRSTFATHSLPEVLVSDNGTTYTSTEFQEFTRRKGIRHITIAPHHPSMNGMAERAVRTFKETPEECNISRPGNSNFEVLFPVPAHSTFHYRNFPSRTASGAMSPVMP